MQKSAEAIGSVLALNATHPIMEDNKEFLKKKMDYTDDDFTARKVSSAVY